jgi:hypothetical protein
LIDDGFCVLDGFGSWAFCFGGEIVWALIIISCEPKAGLFISFLITSLLSFWADE